MMKSIHCHITFLIAACCIVAGSAFAEQFVPFVIPAKYDPNSEIQFQYSPLTEQDRLSAKGHFYSSKGRVRLWGVNFTFEANFPTHSDAQQIAERLAQAGINTVRLHHMDTANWPRGIWNTDGKTLNPEALDRLDYFIDQLAKRGIYIDLNLHVGKEHSKTLGLPDSPESYNKMVSLFTPQIIEAQKDYARQLLTHQNKYRPFTYANDPALAIVEITNENSLFMWSAPQVLPNLPKFYADILQQKYNQWLKVKYGSMDKLAAAWSSGSVPLGSNLLLNGDFKKQSPDQPAPDKWRLEQHDTAKAKTSAVTYEGRNALRIETLNSDGIEWHVQLNQGNLKIEKDKIYTLTLQIAADKDCTIALGLIQAESPWKNLGLYKTITPGPKWKQIQFTFTAPDSETNGRFNVAFGKNSTPFYLASIGLQQGAEFKIDKTESLEQSTVNVFTDNESKPRQLDRMMFFAETEKTFFDDMRNYLKKDLGCRAMITGTIVFGPLGLYAQSDMDFIDAHAYWQHPQFPNKPWDSSDWLIEQKAITDYPEESTLMKLASEHLANKPFTVTEYNHPAPLDSQAQCVPIIASFAAAQDWDGVWLYTYSHSNNNWNRDFMNSYFDIDTNPAKWGFMPAGAAMFRFHLHSGLEKSSRYRLTEAGNSLTELAGFHLEHGSNLFEILKQRLSKSSWSWAAVCQEQIAIQLTGGQQAKNSLPVDISKIIWQIAPSGKGSYFFQNSLACISTGYAGSFETLSENMIHITSPEATTLTVTTLDNKPIAESSKILITACGRCENTDMKFSADRTTVGTNWGKGPVQIEPVEATIDLSKVLKGMDKIKVFALNPNGTKKTEVPITDSKIKLSNDYGTMWYLITR
jgi:hypothetical protein